MSQERKILIAKRHDQRSFNRGLNNPPIVQRINQAQKRTHEREETEQPPNKRRNNVPDNGSSSFDSPTRKSKNLAARRLQNLRNSLEEQRRHSESGQSPTTNSRAVHSSLPARYGSPARSGSPAKSTPPTSSATSLSTPKRNIISTSTPVQDRLKRRPDTPFPSPGVSPTPPKNETSRNPNIANVSAIVNISTPEQIEDEEMDWAEIDDKTVVNSILDLRKEIDYKKELHISKDLDNPMCISSDGVFVVVDTNIFLSQLTMLAQLKGKHFEGLGTVTIVVPWMVIQELDYMKESHSSRSIMRAARKAVHYINTQLQAKDPHFTGQTVMDAAKLEMSSRNPDDGIVFSCLQLIEKGKFTVLLSNDINLRNKALINNIQSFPHSDILSSLPSLSSTNKPNGQIVAKLKILLSNLLTHIIQIEMQEAYGAVWIKMGGMQPPFTTEEALGVMAKYWVAVFSFKLQKQAKMKVEEFAAFLKSHPNDSTYSAADFKVFVEHCLSLCIYLRNGYLKYRNIVSECIVNIQNCADS